MNLTCKTISNCLYGDVRTVMIDDLFPVFCAVDVARALGFRDPGSAVRHHCKAPGKLHFEDSCGIRRMNFISISDVNRLCDASADPFAEEIRDWLLDNATTANDEVYEIDSSREEAKEKSQAPRNIIARQSDILEIYDALTLMEDMLNIISEYVSVLIAEA